MDTVKKDAHITTGWRSFFEFPQIYNAFQNFIGGNRERIRQYEENLILNPSDRILDVGCGTGKLAGWIPDGVEYIGYDMNESYIEQANRDFGDKGRFFCEKVGETETRWNEYFDIVFAHGLLHHLNDEESSSLMRCAKAYLKEGGYFVTVDSVYHKDQSSLDRWVVSKDRGQNIRLDNEYLDLAKKHFSKVEGKIEQGKLRIPFSTYTMKCYK